MALRTDRWTDGDGQRRTETDGDERMDGDGRTNRNMDLRMDGQAHRQDHVLIKDDTRNGISQLHFSL